MHDFFLGFSEVKNAFLSLHAKSISKILYQTLSLFSQMKDTKHIRRDFHSVAWVMSQGSTLGRWRCRGVILFFKHGHVAYQIDGDDIFIPKFVCVVQMNDTKHIRQDFHSVTLVMAQGWDFGALGVPRGVNFFKHGHVAYQIYKDDKQNKMQVKFSS